MSVNLWFVRKYATLPVIWFKQIVTVHFEAYIQTFFWFSNFCSMKWSINQFFKEDYNQNVVTCRVSVCFYVFFFNLNLSFRLDVQIYLHIELTKECTISIIFSWYQRKKWLKKLHKIELIYFSWSVFCHWTTSSVYSIFSHPESH
jgi:hypothetical protein